MNFMFILGRDSELSFIELISYFNCKSIHYDLVDYSGEVAVFSIPKFDFKKAITQLGGIVKIGLVIQNLDNMIFVESKVKYALSVYNHADPSIFLGGLKSHFKEQRVRAFIKKPKKGVSLTPSDVISHKLIDEGFEFLISKDFVAKTVAVFDPSLHELRDESRPEKDYLKTISIRLAKILINLSQPNKSLLDPFCGYGTILQEALLMNFEVYGIDSDQKTVSACKKNMAWLQAKYKPSGNWRVFCNDARNVSKVVTNVDSVATEPYLGPFLKKIPSKNEALRIISDLEPVYSAFLKELRKVVKGKVAMIVPRFRTKDNTIISMDFSGMLLASGFKSVSFPIVKIPVIYLTGKIEREIWVFE